MFLSTSRCILFALLSLSSDAHPTAAEDLAHKDTAGDQAAWNTRTLQPHAGARKVDRMERQHQRAHRTRKLLQTEEEKKAKEHKHLLELYLSHLDIAAAIKAAETRGAEWSAFRKGAVGMEAALLEHAGDYDLGDGLSAEEGPSSSHPSGAQSSVPVAAAVPVAVPVAAASPVVQPLTKAAAIPRTTPAESSPMTVPAVKSVGSDGAAVGLAGTVGSAGTAGSAGAVGSAGALPAGGTGAAGQQQQGVRRRRGEGGGRAGGGEALADAQGLPQRRRRRRDEAANQTGAAQTHLGDKAALPDSVKGVPILGQLQPSPSTNLTVASIDTDSHLVGSSGGDQQIKRSDIL